MSFSREVKENLSKISNFNKNFLQSELLGYIFCGNTVEYEKYFEFFTENEFNIEHLYKLLFNLNIDYDPEVKGKLFIAQMDKKNIEKILNNYEKIIKGESEKYFVKGAFLGSGSVNNPEKNYHLEISFINENYADFVKMICEKYTINLRKIKVNEKYQLYLKESEEISKFLALVGANLAVLKFEDIRIMKDVKNNVNRKVNCETANLNKTIEAAIVQIENIKLIKKKRKFNSLPSDLKEIANARVENPELSLKDLGLLFDPVLPKSTVNRKLKKIEEIAENLK